jgi:8-oxo-dGTP pyrophosphatase MutT (NUDIX family)
MADGLYKSLGVPVPSFMVLDSLEEFSNFRPSQEKWPKGPYRIAEFIEGHMLTKGQLDKEVRSSFVADAFLANRDIAAGIERNVIIKDNIAYRIDNGGSLRFRSKGERKGGAEDPWDSSLIPELKTLLDHGAMVYQGLSPEEVQKQMQEILKRTPEFLETFQKISRALNLSEQNQTELEHMLIGRLRTLTVLANPKNTYGASRNRYTSPFTAAGAFILSTDKEKPFVLLGQRNSSQRQVHGTWCTLGGKADYGIDLDLATAASREIYEESGKRINIPDTELRIASSHDLIRPDHLFRQYIITIPYVDLADIHYHEYIDYQWIPLEKLLSQETLETGEIEGSSMKLFEPFWDMLRTEQVQYLLNEYILNRSQTRELHTQSTLQNSRLPVNGKINKFPPQLSSTQFEKEHQLGHSVINKSILIRDIKKTPEEAPVDGHHYAPNDDLSSPYRYTASEGQLKIYLGGQYTPVTSLEILRSLKKNIVTALKKSPPKLGSDSSARTRASEFLGDKFFNAQLLNALMKERSYDPRFMVLYHACEGNIGFLYDIFTELKQLLSGQFHQDSQMFRGIDEAFKDVHSILTFQRKFGIDPESQARNTFKGNYTGNYQDMAISTNFFLFGNPGNPTSCTFALFFDSESLRPVDIGKFLSYLENVFGGLKLDKDRYTRLYESIIKEPRNLDGRLYQIFINPDYINTLVYGALAQGAPYYFDYARLRDLLRTEKIATEFPDVTRSVTHNCTPHMAPPKISLATTSTAPKGFFEVLKENPDLFAEAVSDAQRHVGRGETGANILQARLLLSPECFHNPQIVKTFLYHRTEKAQENHEKFLEKLREYLKEDLSVWFHKKEQLESGVSIHAETPTAARTRYSELYKENFGKQYVPQGVPFNKILAKVNSSKDTSLLEELIRKYGFEQVLLTPIISADSYKEGFSDLGSRSALLYETWVTSYLKKILNDTRESSPESLLKRESFGEFLIQPLMVQINQLKGGGNFADIIIPPFLFNRSAKTWLDGFSKVFLLSLVEKRILERPLLSKEIFDIFNGFFFNSSDFKLFFNIDLSFPQGKMFMGKLIRNFLDQEGISFDEKQAFLKKLAGLPEIKDKNVQDTIFSSILESSLSEEQKMACEPWEKIYRFSKNRDLALDLRGARNISILLQTSRFIINLYGINLNNPLEKYRLIEKLHPIWGGAAAEVTAGVTLRCLSEFSMNLKQREGAFLTAKNINQLTHFLKSLGPIIKADYNKSGDVYRLLDDQIRQIRDAYWLGRAVEKFSQNPVVVKDLEYLQNFSFSGRKDEW